MRPPESLEDPFWRLAGLPDPNTCLLLSRSRLVTVDFRVCDFERNLLLTSLAYFQSPESVLSLVAVQNPGTVFTYVEGVRVDNMIRVASTEEITWIDQRFPLRPVLGVKHCRQWDRTLRIQSLMIGQGKLGLSVSSLRR